MLAHYQLSAALSKASQQQVLAAITGISHATTLRFNPIQTVLIRKTVQGKVDSEGTVCILCLSYSVTVVHIY